jgi:hypothetical protein
VHDGAGDRAMNRAALLLLLAIASLSMGAADAAADEGGGRPATFALIIGSNRSVDADVAPLKYADDDATQYLDLFRLLGARTYLLTSLDENTRRLHPQAAAEALEPRRASLDQAVAQLAVDVGQARDRHVDTTVYFIFAGHGNVDDSGTGYIALEDARITGADLARMVARIPATRVHIIADACASYMLAYSRGPGGQRRPVQGFQDAAQLANDPRVGLLLSTSSARESHEWDAYQAGVFSHEVRSGLYGAADADGDGRVSYREIAAFVQRANAQIPNERFRPDVHAKAPAGSDELMDLRAALSRRLDVDGAHAAHYFIEDGQGVRLVDFHNATGQPVHLVRPSPNGHVYVRRFDDTAEFTVPAWPNEIALADLSPEPPRVASRGAAHEAFEMLFALPFDEASVKTYRESAPEDVGPVAGEDRSSRKTPVRAVVGFTGLGVGAVAIGTGVVLSVLAVTTSHSGASVSESEVAGRNRQIANYNDGAAIGYAVGGLGLATALGALLWPEGQHLRMAATPTGATVGYGGTF